MNILNDNTCLHHIMVNRCGGTRPDCPKCGKHSKFCKMKYPSNYVCQYCGHHKIRKYMSDVGRNVSPKSMATKSLILKGKQKSYYCFPCSGKSRVDLSGTSLVERG